MSRTTPLTSKRCILYIYSTNIGTEYFKHALYSQFFFPLQNSVCFIMLTCLVPILFTFYIQGVLKLKKYNSGTKGLKQPCSVFSKKNPIIRNFCISGWFAVPTIRTSGVLLFLQPDILLSWAGQAGLLFPKCANRPLDPHILPLN